MKTINDNLEEEGSKLSSRHLDANETKYKSNSGKLTEADKMFREDPKYIELTDENNALKEKIKQTDK